MIAATHVVNLADAARFPGEAPTAIPSLVRAAAARRPARTAVWFPADRGYASWTYAELQDRIARVARGLSERGVGAGDHVVMLVPIRPELYVALLAVMSLGAVAVFVEPGSAPSELARVVRFVDAKAFIGIPKAHALRPLFRDIGRVPVQVVVGRLPVGLRAVSFDALADGEPLADFPSLAGDDPAILTFSSGTTGEPKGAVRSHGFLGAQHRAIEELAGADQRADDVDLTSFAIGALSCFASGATVILPRFGAGGVDDIDADELVDLAVRERVTTLSGAPAFMNAVFSAAARRSIALDSVRRASSGGAPVSPALCELTAQVVPNARFSVIYGSTEAEPIAVIDGPELAVECLGSSREGAGLCVGRVHRDIELRLLRWVDGPIVLQGDATLDGLTVASGQVGEVVVSGPHVNRRYFRNPDAERATKIVEADGTVWHRTGDAAYLDERSRLWIVGRCVDAVQTSLGPAYPASAEAVAQTLPFVARAALVSDDAGTVHAVVEPQQRRDLLRWLGSRRHRARMRDQLVSALHKASIGADAVHFVPTLPVDSRHRSKIDHRRVRKLLPVLRWLP